MAAAVTRFDGGHSITALRTHTGNEQGQGGRQTAHAFNFSRVGGTHHQAQLPVRIPRALRQLGNVLVHQGLPFHRSQALVLQIITTRIGRAAQQKSTLAVVLQIRLHRVKAHERRQGDSIGAITLKRLFGILLSRRANVTTLGVQNDGHMGRIAAHVCHQFFQLVFSAVRCKVSNLGFEGDGQIGRGIDNLRTKFINLAGVTLHARRKFIGLGV